MKMGANIFAPCYGLENKNGALVKLQIAKENTALLFVLLALCCQYWHVAHVW